MIIKKLYCHGNKYTIDAYLLILKNIRNSKDDVASQDGAGKETEDVLRCLYLKKEN